MNNAKNGNYLSNEAPHVIEEIDPTQSLVNVANQANNDDNDSVETIFVESLHDSAVNNLVNKGVPCSPEHIQVTAYDSLKVFILVK